MIASFRVIGCKEDGSSHFSCHEHPPISETKQYGRNPLIPSFLCQYLKVQEALLKKQTVSILYSYCAGKGYAVCR